MLSSKNLSNLNKFLYYTKTDKNGIIVDVSDSFCQLSGYKRDELIGSPHSIIKHPATSSKTFHNLWQKILNKDTYTGRIQNLTKGNKSFWTDVVIFALLDEKENISGFCSYRLNITDTIDKQQMKDSIAQQSILLKALMDNSFSSLIITDENFIIKKYNKIAKDEILNIKKEISMDNIMDHPYVVIGECDIYVNINFNRIFEYLSNLKLNDDIVIHINNKYFLIKYQCLNIDTYKYMFSFKDVTALMNTKNRLKAFNSELEKRIEKESSENELKTHQLISQSKLATMGEMVSMIAHQWRQPLSLLNSLIIKQDLKRELEELDLNELKNSFASMKDQIQYMSKTIDDFINYGKPSLGQSVFICDVIQKSKRLINPIIESKHIKFIETLNCCSYGKLYIESNDFEQVLLNIYKNAIDVLEERKIENPTIMLNVFTNNDLIFIDIIDNAGGMDEDNISKVFDPYFSTKGLNGTGLGLYMSKNMIENKLKGTIKMINVEDGMKVSIKIPAKKESN